MSFKQQFAQLGNQLQRDRRIEVVRFEMGETAREFDWEVMQAGTSIEGMAFPQPAADIILDLNGYHLEWIVKDRVIPPYEAKFREELFGRIWLYDPAELISMFDGGEWKETLAHHSGSNNPDETPALIPFDYYHPDYSGCACFRIQGGRIRKHITFHSSQLGFYHSSLDIEEYFSLLVASGGLLTAREGLLMSGGLHRSKMLYYIPLIFPQSPIKKLVSDFDRKHRKRK